MSTIFNYSQLQVEAALKLLKQIEMNSLEGIRAYQFARYLSFHYLLQGRGQRRSLQAGLLFSFFSSFFWQDMSLNQLIRLVDGDWWSAQKRESERESGREIYIWFGHAAQAELAGGHGTCIRYVLKLRIRTVRPGLAAPHDVCAMRTLPLCSDSFNGALRQARWQLSEPFHLLFLLCCTLFFLCFFMFHQMPPHVACGFQRKIIKLSDSVTARHCLS